MSLIFEMYQIIFYKCSKGNEFDSSKYISEQIKYFPTVKSAILILYSLSVITTSIERSFSTMKRIKKHEIVQQFV